MKINLYNIFFFFLFFSLKSHVVTIIPINIVNVKYSMKVLPVLLVICSFYFQA